MSKLSSRTLIYLNPNYQNSTVVYLADNGWQDQTLTNDRFLSYLNAARQWDSTEVTFVGVLIPKRLAVYLVHSKEASKISQVEQKLQAAIPNSVTFQADFNSFLQLVRNYPSDAFRYYIRLVRE
ncbi:MAG: hypothetical protein NZ576_10355 [Bacteroidia bacterium]|nr:hypothetical protein [Bacteroidia bacterium]